MTPIRRTILSLLTVGCLTAVGLGAYVFAPVAPITPLTVDDVDLSPLDAVSPETWAALRTKRIYFGHMSVGSNILDGVREILRRRPGIGLEIRNVREPGAFDRPGLIEGPLAANEDPFGKLQEFERLLASEVGASLDMACMKFCYADLKKDGPSLELARAYQSTVTSIAAARPTVRVLHMTMPLTWIQRGPKARVKAMLGRTAGIDNHARETFNRSFRSTWHGPALFDLAGLQSRTPSGDVVRFEHDGSEVPALAYELTDDGGHFHLGGATLIAREFLLFLAQQCELTERGESSP